MAASMQIVRERVKMFKDLDLIALICLMDIEHEGNKNKYDAFSSQFDQWKMNIKNSGPGTIDLELDSIAPSSSSHNQLLLMLDAVRDRLTSYQETVPATVLQERCPVEGVKFVDYPVMFLVDTIASLRELLEQA
jgi:hypothetical protein